jgi:hypothetical protein
MKHKKEKLALYKGDTESIRNFFPAAARAS